MHLFIIAGHGAGDPGATGNGYTEAERVRALAAHIGALGGSNVTIADTSRNWYADNGISKLTKTETAGKLYRVYEQKGAFKSKANAEALQKKLQKEGKTAIII